jgi:formiminotetrahydrofolate cyclodeaminase
MFMEVLSMVSATSCKEFLDKLASKSPVPGGGGASSLIAAIGVALGSMVGNLTLGKKKYIKYEADINRILIECSQLQNQFLALVQKDADVFDLLLKAYSLPKDTPKEQEKRDIAIEEALDSACSVPLEIMENCVKAIDLHGELADISTKIAISDVGVGAIACNAAIRGASLNVFINTQSMKNRKNAEILNTKAKDILNYAVKKSEDIYNNILKVLE